MPSRTITNAISEVIIDPVCGMNVPPGKKDLVSEHKHHTYYFSLRSVSRPLMRNPKSMWPASPQMI